MTELEQKKSSSSLTGLLVTVVIPAIILLRFTGEAQLGPTRGLLVALAFPLGYGFLEFRRQHTVNFLAVLGIIGVFLTGGIGLFKLDPKWLAVKEAAIPLFIGGALLVSHAVKRPLLLVLLRQGLDMDRITQKASERQAGVALERHLTITTYIVAGSFGVSALLNYILTKVIVVSPAGTEAFNRELGKLTLLSYPVIVVPSLLVMGFATFYLLRGASRLTGLEISDLLKS